MFAYMLSKFTHVNTSTYSINLSDIIKAHSATTGKNDLEQFLVAIKN